MKFEQLKPTPLVPRGGVISPNVIPPCDKRLRYLVTVYQLSSAVFSLLWLIATGKKNSIVFAKRVKRMFEDLGYLWLRAAQLLAMRNDVFSENMCKELSQVKYHRMAFPVEISRQVVEQYTKGKFEDTFEEFQEKPFAVLTIAQIHRARLKKENTWVAVKVMRPDAADIYAKDMAFYRFIVRMLSRLKIGTHLRLDEALWELDEIAKEETDYRYELTHTETMRKNLRKHGVLVPKIFRRYCSAQVMVSEYITGVPLSVYIKAVENDADNIRDWEIENNVERQVVAKTLYMSFMRQLFEDNVCHGDLNANNIVLLRGSRVALINFDSVDRPEANLLIKLRLIAQALSENELQKAADYFLSLSPSFPMVDVNAVIEDMVRSLRAWYLRTPVKNVEFSDKAIGRLFSDLLRIMNEKKIFISWALIKVNRSWYELDATMEHLYPEIDHTRIFRRYFRDRQRRTLKQIARPTTVAKTLVGIPEAISEYRMFVDPQLRQASRVFQGGSSKVTDALSAIFGILSNGVFIVAVCMGVIFGHQHHTVFDWIGYDVGDVVYRIRSYTEVVPYLGKETWFVLGCLMTYVWYKLFKLRRRFGQAEVRLPNASTGS